MLKESRKPEDIKRLERIRGNLLLRGRLLKAIRSYFDSRNFLEIETPIAVRSPAPEDYINAPQAGDFFLRASPELHMKRMIAAGYGDIYQIGSCFREGETGRLHNPEFTMLEWYHTGKDYLYLLSFLREMLIDAAVKVTGSPVVRYKESIIDFAAGWHVITVREAFESIAGIPPEKAIEDNLFEILLTEKIEPVLPKDRPVIMMDYPRRMAALSRLKNENREYAERWELYLAGIEIANAYSELTDPVEQRIRFAAAHTNRDKNGLPKYPDDDEFFKALEYGIPDFTGCALGIDRLAMILSGAEHIEGVRSFKE